MKDYTLVRQLTTAVNKGDRRVAAKLLADNAVLRTDQELLDDCLRHAATHDNVEMLEFLVSHGANIHASDTEGAPEGIIYRAAGAGATRAVRWLLEHGAKTNYQIDGVTRCLALSSAAHMGHLEVVKLLVEMGGANINAMWDDFNPLTYAIMYGQKEIEAYLRSKGAKEPWELKGEPPPFTTSTWIEHLEKHLGKPKLLALPASLASGALPIKVHVVAMKNKQALVTEGMSAQPMTTPPGGGNFQNAELLIYLPGDWPLTKKALEDANNFWPAERLVWAARYPHEHQTWLGGASGVLCNGKPPKPFAPDTKLSCLLFLTEDNDFCWMHLPDGKLVVLYTAMPIYAEESKLEKENGTAHLVQLFQKHRISRVVDPHRPNVASAGTMKGDKKGK